MGTGVSKNLSVITKFDTSGCDETSQPEDGSKIFWDQHEDREQRDFVDCGWDNIGSFDDLDRIFSNDDAIFGHASLGNADQLWSSSKEATSAAEKSFPLSTNSPRFGLGTLRSQSGCNEVKTEYVQEKDQSFHQGFGGTSYHTTYAQQNVHRSADQVNYAGGQTGPAAKEKTELEMHGKSLGFNSHLAAENITRPNDFRDKKRISKTRKRSGGREGHLLQDSSNIWSPHGNQLQQYDQIPPSVPHIGTASILSQQTQPQGPACSQYQQSSNSFVAPSMFGSIKNQYSTMTSSPKNYFMKDDQSVLSDYECSPNTTSPLSGFPGTSTNPLRMTPQEKIEKLRKRQQMRALLAIQKQQQKFRHRVSTNDYSVAQNCLRKNQIELMHGGNTEAEENVSTLLPIDPISPIEQDDSNTIPMAVDDYYSMEDTILHQLQDAIAKLDVRIRLCIRDSLSRLAKSAMRKHYANDTRSTNKTSRDEVEVITKEETSSHSRVTPIPDVETQTNPIDRAVAHLLFHRSFESSGKHPETPESPASTKLPLQCSPRGFVPDNYRSEQKVSYHDPHSVAEGDQSRSPCIDTSENASNNEESDGGGMEIDASQ
ncbi:hypothetical protein CEY00_Acc09250 [Actinidia chinensis var. chinensis]|uniref:Uncharacterized protein n=1 Tax=Actinidia chinensis var. chinensis TaxID=1590841 RepID=A0A2R6R9W0_ACTCC|nr:hypothetical protein CEY00_Acc09250 [Actinidia chinensis var. chinensis]